MNAHIAGEALSWPLFEAAVSARSCVTHSYINSYFVSFHLGFQPSYGLKTNRCTPSTHSKQARNLKPVVIHSLLTAWKYHPEKMSPPPNTKDYVYEVVCGSKRAACALIGRLIIIIRVLKWRLARERRALWGVRRSQRATSRMLPPSRCCVVLTSLAPRTQA